MQKEKPIDLTYLRLLCSSQSIHVLSIGIDGYSCHNISSCEHRAVSWSPFNHNEDNVKIGGALEGYSGGNTTINFKGVKNFTEKEAKTVFPAKKSHYTVNKAVIWLAYTCTRKHRHLREHICNYIRKYIILTWVFVNEFIQIKSRFICLLFLIKSNIQSHFLIIKSVEIVQ